MPRGGTEIATWWQKKRKVALLCHLFGIEFHAVAGNFPRVGKNKRMVALLCHLFGIECHDGGTNVTTLWQNKRSVALICHAVSAFFCVYCIVC